jgi:hypothetical protein
LNDGTKNRSVTITPWVNKDDKDKTFTKNFQVLVLSYEPKKHKKSKSLWIYYSSKAGLFPYLTIPDWLRLLEINLKQDYPLGCLYFTTRILVTKASGLLKPSLPAVENTRYTPVATISPLRSFPSQMAWPPRDLVSYRI